MRPQANSSGEHPTLFCKSVLARASSSKCTISRWSFLLAQMRGVPRTWFAMFASASASSNKRTISECPSSQAQISGVSPSQLHLSGLLLASNRKRTQSTFPSVANMRGVPPLWLATSWLQPRIQTIAKSLWGLTASAHIWNFQVTIAKGTGNYTTTHTWGKYKCVCVCHFPRLNTRLRNLFIIPTHS